MSVEKIITKYDFLTSLDIHKLAEFIYEVVGGNVCDYCAYKHTVKCDDGRCVGGIIELLKTPYEANDFIFL